jgi:prolipoprotein diacylglyceryltransferase
VRFTGVKANEIRGVPLDVSLHPAQLYEFGLLMTPITWRLFQSPHRPRTVFGAYLMLADGQRFVVEFFSEHQQANFLGGPFSNAQRIAIALACAGAF